MNFLDQPIFICGAPRSGTTLLSNLLDGHDELLCYPYEPLITEKYFYWQNTNPSYTSTYFSRDYIHSFDIKSIICSEYIKWRGELACRRFGKSAKVLTHPNLSEATEKEFSFILSKSIQDRKNDDGSIPLNQVVRSLILAYHGLESPTIEPKYFVSKRPLVNEFAALKLKDEFPRARFIHILRDPRTRYLSAKMRDVKKYPMGLKFASSINGLDFATHRSRVSMTSFMLAEQNKRILGDDYVIVRYEDLASRREETMAMICNSLGINLSNKMEEQTEFGIKIEAKSSFKKSIRLNEDISSDRLKRYIENTSEHERHIIAYYSAKSARKFGYDIQSAEGKPFSYHLKRLKFENPKDYINNRLRSMRQAGSMPFHVTQNAYEEICQNLSIGKVPQL
ncbi:sulfotransferase [Puniceicoccaceae bacterium K14]|nr:sulfotransferase [Puniceicoccaceae bacterium K14]